MQFLMRTVYGKEILLIIVMKLLALTLLWALFFSHPTHHSLSKKELSKHFLL